MMVLKDTKGFKKEDIIDYLEYCGWDPIGKDVVVIGCGTIAKLLTDAGATVTLCHSRTKNIWKYLGSADLVICAIGKRDFLNCYAIHIPVIDMGMNLTEDGKIVGDCFNIENRNVVHYV
jgi:methylenetetrahydrofolate dehydrogenase (NADP+)/methenyltetrahydrofolate cyclohydrolase